jgi:hypothetical protein
VAVVDDAAATYLLGFGSGGGTDGSISFRSVRVHYTTRRGK